MEKMKTIIAAIIACLPFMLQAQSTELTCWTTKGKQMKLPVEDNNLEIPDSVAAIDLCGIDGITLNCSSANPNCLYYTDGTTSVEGLPNANVVYEGVCDGLLLTDDAHFYCPMTFTAVDAMLRFTPRLDEGEADFNQPSHETVMLPFDADFVIPEDVNGPMPEGWLQMAIYRGYENKMLIFGQIYGECLNANTPYLVRFAYGAYGTHILFCGQDITVEETKTAIADIKPYSFTGMTMSKDETPGYFRYHRGQETYFIHTGDGMPMEPFRCFIVDTKYNDSQGTDPSGEPIGNVSDKILDYIVVEEESTGIDTRIMNPSNKACYDLQGRQLPDGNRSKGLFISGGVKVIK